MIAPNYTLHIRNVFGRIQKACLPITMPWVWAGIKFLLHVTQDSVDAPLGSSGLNKRPDYKQGTPGKEVVP